MSDRLSSWWVRLYPASFRERYGDEMLLLLRDRMRDEVGMLGRLKIRVELLRDLTVTLPQVYLDVRRRKASEALAVSGPLTFRVIDEKGPRWWIYGSSTLASVMVLHMIKSLHPCTAMPVSGNGSAFGNLHGLLSDLVRFVIQ